MRFRSLAAEAAQWLAAQGLRPADPRTRQALMIALAAPLAPVPMVIGAAAILPGGIAERLDLLGICILTGLTAALCAALGVLYVLTLPSPPQELGRSKGRSLVQALTGDTSALPEQPPLRRAG